jgi:drug/metabolite transporter (DMT)-like permease
LPGVVTPLWLRPSLTTTLTTSSRHADHPSDLSRLPLWGALCALFAAFGYTIANGCLRAAAHCDPIWVSAVKAVPTAALIAPWLIVQAARGERLLPPPRVLGILTLGGLVGQLGGNVPFQWSLGIIGMALAVPLTMGTIIVSGALLGRAFLGEPITQRALASIGTLLVAITFLSLGAGDAHRSVVPMAATVAAEANWWILAAGVGAAMVSGLAYSILGTVIRYGVSGRATMTTTLVTVSLTGIASLGLWSAARIGWSGMCNTASADLATMLLAGVCNAISFLALTRAMQLTTLVYVNALNSSQLAMAAVVGIIFFGEARSPELVLGVVLTIVGLLLMRQRRRREAG